MNSPPLPKGLVLTTNDIQTWKGWCLLHDREIVRLSVELGTQINLAKIFIASRRSWDLDEVEKWYKAEVTAWVIQLLSTGEIQIAVEILENSKIDVITQLLVIGIEIKDRKTIKTISDYLSNCKISEIYEIQENINNFLSHFHLLGCLESVLSQKQQLDIIILENDLIKSQIITYKESTEYTVQEIQKQSKLWKSKVAARLYFEKPDNKLIIFLDADSSWEDLLQNNNINLIKEWIYSSFTGCDNLSTEPNMLFKSWVITDAMISRISCFPCMNFTKEELYDYIATFGYFIESERNNIVLLLNRLSRNTSSNSISDILTQKCSNVTLDQLYKLLVDYCEPAELKTMITKCINSNFFSNNFIHNVCTVEKKQWIKLSKIFLDLIKNPNDESEILKCINYTSNYFADNKLDEYIVNNPCIFIAMILFDRTKSLPTIFTSETNCDIYENINWKVLEKLPHLKLFLQNTNLKAENISNDISLIDMLKQYQDIKLLELFDQNLNFDNEHLMENLGYKAKMTYDYYVRTTTPCFALKSLYINKLVNDGNIKLLENDITSNISQLMRNNWNDIEIMCSAISFMSILDLNCNNLRYYINAAQSIYRSSLKLKHDSQTVNENYYKITNLLEDLCEKDKIIEFTSHLAISNMNVISQLFVNNLIHWKTMYNICIAHNMNVPDCFLVFCATNNKWAWFLLFAQVYSFPFDQVYCAIKYFKSDALRAHLFAALGDRINESSRCQDEESMNENIWKFIHFAHKNINSCNTLLNICQLHPGNPILAAIAACYKPDSVIECWYIWLSTAINFKTTNESYINISIEDVSQIINHSASEGFIVELNESLLIFAPGNCLTFFTNILVKITAKNELESNITDLLIAFKNISMNLHMIPHLNIYNLFEDRNWLINKAIELCCIVISNNFKSYFHTKTFLKYLCDSKLTKNIETNVNFDHLLTLLQCISKTNVKLDISAIILNDEETKLKEYKKCLEDLIKEKQFEKALRFADITNIDKDEVIIAHMKHRYHTLIVNDSDDMSYWLDCNKIFNDSKLLNVNPADFFLDFADNLDVPKFKYILYHLALIWENTLENSSRNIDEIEKQMWISYINIEKPDDVAIYSSKTLDALTSPAVLYNSIEELKIKACIDSLSESNYSLSKKETENLFKLISLLLDLGDFVTALRVQMMFSYSHSELQLLITIMALAESSLSPYQMTPTQRMTLLQSKCVRSASGQFGKRTLKSKLSTSGSLCSGSPNGSFVSAVFSDYIEIPSREKQDTLCTIEALAARLKVGRFSGQRIVMCYRAAMHMDKEYLDILRYTDTLNLLQEVITGSCMNKLVVISDIISASGFTSLQVAEFLVHEIFKAIVASTNAKNKKDALNLNVTILWGYNLSIDYHLFLELTSSPSDIGNLLLEYQTCIQELAQGPSRKRNKRAMSDIQTQIKKVLDNNKKLTNIEINTICVDILIYAHDSYTKDCNIEGIALILSRAQLLCSQLLQTKSWGLMVKMLTGISRYTEMTYIFEIIKANHQFEFLLSQFNHILRQQDSKKNVLKMALLEFLKTYWPQDAELKQLVALHFQMHSEVAELLKIEASDIIKRMINIAILEMTSHDLNLKAVLTKCQPFVLLKNTVEIRNCLFRAMNTFCHSSEYYVQQNKLSLAMKCAHEAELVALQIDLLNKAPVGNKAPNVVCILQLKPEQIEYVINKELSFHQGIILQRAYDYSVNWINALYEHCIIKGDMQYLNSYNKYFKITESMASELAMKFQKETKLTKQMIESLRNIIGCVKSTADRYRLSSLLGQRDIVENILSSESVCFLKDTVFIGKNVNS